MLERFFEAKASGWLCWLAGWLAGFAGWLAGFAGFAGWLCWLACWLAGLLACWLACLLAGWLAGLLAVLAGLLAKKVPVVDSGTCFYILSDKVLGIFRHNCVTGHQFCQKKSWDFSDRIAS